MSINALAKIQAGMDKVCTKLAAKGFREHTVTLRQVTMTGKNASLGLPGTAVNTDTLLAPAPIVANVSLRAIQYGAGLLQEGDLRITNISRSATYQALVQDPATQWVITGPSFAGTYSLVGGAALQMKPAEWIATVRKVTGE